MGLLVVEQCITNRFVRATREFHQAFNDLIPRQVPFSQAPGLVDDSLLLRLRKAIELFGIGYERGVPVLKSLEGRLKHTQALHAIRKYEPSGHQPALSPPPHGLGGHAQLPGQLFNGKHTRRHLLHGRARL